MRTTYFSKAMTFLPLLLLVPVLQAQTSETTGTNPGVSKVRIVRLSQVRGSVQIDRSDGRGYERAIANLPIVEGNELRTGEGVAEVEFEDNTSLRLAPNSQVEFPRLERSAAGATLSSVHLARGTAYISVVKAQSKAAPNEFTAVFGDRKLNLDPGAHVRLAIEGTEAKLAVLDGAVRVDQGNGESISKRKTATFELFGEGQPTVSRNVETSMFDEWDHESASYHSNAASLSAFNSPYAYGLRDMSYYGSFVNAAGCGGSMWRPYFASAAWDPFANGTWAWYQGAGYSWVSPYPWGWTPYHYGSWAYCDNLGWGWIPGEGGSWYGLNNVAALTPIERSTGGGGHVQPPRLPVHPPLPHAPSMITISTKPIPVSQIASSSKFEFRKDSAGLGVPRGTLGNLNKFSRESLSHGTASTAVYASVPRTGQSFGGITNSELLATSIHRGSLPSSGSSPSQGSYNGSYNGGSYSGSGSGGGMGGGRSAGASAPAASAGPSMPSGGGGVKR